MNMQMEREGAAIQKVWCVSTKAFQLGTREDLAMSRELVSAVIRACEKGDVQRSQYRLNICIAILFAICGA